MRLWPAVEVALGAGDPDEQSALVIAEVDELEPTSVEERPGAVRVFFSSHGQRDVAADMLTAAGWRARRVDVDDEDWARRSQEHLAPVTVGEIAVRPQASGFGPQDYSLSPQPLALSPIEIVIVPSMGFGTGHHATTRLCLEALQAIDVNGAFVLDVGTGSGILAIAADRLGAARALGIDSDADAIQAARENLERNPEATRVRLEVVDLTIGDLPPADVVIANLTGALLVRAAATLAAALAPGGRLILGGLQSNERDAVVGAFPGLRVQAESSQDEWLCLVFQKTA